MRHHRPRGGIDRADGIAADGHIDDIVDLLPLSVGLCWETIADRVRMLTVSTTTMYKYRPDLVFTNEFNGLLISFQGAHKNIWDRAICICNAGCIQAHVPIVQSGQERPSKRNFRRFDERATAGKALEISVQLSSCIDTATVVFSSSRRVPFNSEPNFLLIFGPDNRTDIANSCFIALAIHYSATNTSDFRSHLNRAVE